MAKHRGEERERLLTDQIQPTGRIDWTDALTPRGPSAKVAEDASAELGAIGPEDPSASDLPADISPDGFEQRGRRGEARETARPSERPPRPDDD
ncbi:MAG: hypothetical protein ACYCWW_16250 [Deltaproteobacteria bacterium]